MRLGTLALATLMLGGCKSTAVAETKEIQTQRTKDLVIVLLNEKGELAGDGIASSSRSARPAITSLSTSER